MTFAATVSPYSKSLFKSNQKLKWHSRCYIASKRDLRIESDFTISWSGSSSSMSYQVTEDRAYREQHSEETSPVYKQLSLELKYGVPLTNLCAASRFHNACYQLIVQVLSSLMLHVKCPLLKLLSSGSQTSPRSVGNKETCRAI